MTSASPNPSADSTGPSVRPNVVVFYVDDMGYGDAGCFNPACKIPTPHLDAFAREGMCFTDAHSTSAVCTPARYGLLTGRYNWRSRQQQGIVPVFGDPLIDAERLTLAGYFLQHGYRTACFGKWHLGMGWDFEKSPDFMPGRDAFTFEPVARDLEASDEQRARWREAFSKPTTGGPTTRGFDEYFGVDVPNWPPYCYIENDRTVGIPTEFLPARLLTHHQASTPGPAVPYWHFEQLLPMWATKAEAYFAQRAADRAPFFLYLPMTSPHTPLSPNAEWVGQSGLNSPYADLMMETDAIFGRVLAALKQHGLDDNTLVVFSSDNGFASYVGAKELEAQGHYPSGPLRGYKSDVWDGGHRVPLVARWPGVVPAGTRCDQLVCQTDLFRTCADALGDTLPDHVAEDSMSILPLLRGENTVVREQVVSHSNRGKFALRDKQWKLVLAPGSGGWTKVDAEAADEGLPLVQLYDLQSDLGEQRNLYKKHPDRVKDMLAQLNSLVSAGRSTPGAPQDNDAAVDIWKLDSMPGVTADMLDDY